MRLGIDATAVSGSVVGHSSYVANLIKGILSIERSKSYEWVIYTRGKTPAQYPDKSNRIQFKSCPMHNRKICEQFWLSLHAPFDGLNLFHSTWSLPIVTPRTCVLTLHGLASYLYPNYFTNSYRVYWASAIRRNYKKPKRYIAISRSTKEDFIRYMNIPESKIDIIYHGVDLDFFTRTLDEKKLNRLKTKYMLPTEYILFVSALIPIKNIETLIKSYSILIEDKNFKDVCLVIAGSKGWKYNSIFELVKDLKLEKKVIFTGYFPQEDLPALYSASRCFVLPSLYEGFGIPVLEAFACGTPVITSNTSSLPEVAGDAAILIDPQKPEELADAMEKVLLNEALQLEMISKGLERAKRFSWQQTAEKTLETYENAILS